MTALADVLARIPYLAPHGLLIEGLDGGAVRVRMEARPGLLNHVGVLHAGALFTAAETAAGVAAWGVVPGDAALVLLRRAEVRYVRRAESPVTATADVDGAAAAAARQAFAASGRGDVAVAARASDAAGTTVLEATFDYALRPRAPGARP